MTSCCYLKTGGSKKYRQSENEQILKNRFLFSFPPPSSHRSQEPVLMFSRTQLDKWSRLCNQTYLISPVPCCENLDNLLNLAQTLPSSVRCNSYYHKHHMFVVRIKCNTCKVLSVVHNKLIIFFSHTPCPHSIWMHVMIQNSRLNR